MAEYIEREALIEEISKLEVEGAFTGALKNATLKTISEEPAADVQEVRHGKWKPMSYTNGLFKDDDFDKCSLCGYERLIGNVDYKTTYNYCPHCGAKMDNRGVKE